MSPEPEIYVLDRSESSDEFLILACDGIWDVMGNRGVCHFVRSRLLISDDLQHICNQVVNTCLHKVSVVTYVNHVRGSTTDSVTTGARYDCHLKILRDLIHKRRRKREDKKLVD